MKRELVFNERINTFASMTTMKLHRLQGGLLTAMDCNVMAAQERNYSNLSIIKEFSSFRSN